MQNKFKLFVYGYKSSDFLHDMEMIDYMLNKNNFYVKVGKFFSFFLALVTIGGIFIMTYLKIKALIFSIAALLIIFIFIDTYIRNMKI